MILLPGRSLRRQVPPVRRVQTSLIELKLPNLVVEAPGRPGARSAYRAYVSDEQRSRAGCIGG